MKPQNISKSLLIFTFGLTATKLVSANNNSLSPINVSANLMSAQSFSVNSKQLNQQLVQSERALFRLQTGINFVEGGRAGGNGFAMRAVDSDRVAISVDGIASAESFMPRSIYTFGKMNGNRNGTEIENLSEIQVNKGADSIAGGNGAIGGSVIMQTKSASDFLLPNHNFGFYSKSSYSSQNEEYRQVLGLGAIYQGLEFALQYVYRRGHELKNHAYHEQENIYGRGRGVPDPVDFHNHSWLVKLGYHFNQAHFLNAWYEASRQSRLTEEKSFYLADIRYSQDHSPYQRYGLQYEYQPENSWLKKLKLQLAKQKVQQYSYGIQYFPQPEYRHLISQTDLSENQQTAKVLSLDLNSQEFKWAHSLHNLTLKAQTSHNRFININKETRYPNTQKTYNLVNPVKSKNFSFSLQDQIMLKDQFALELGVAYHHYHYQPQSGIGFANKKDNVMSMQRKFEGLNWKAGLSYQLNPQFMLSYKFSNAFRAPRVEELYFERHGADHYLANNQIKAEKAQNHEVEFSFENEYASLSLTAFYTKYRDFIEENEEVRVQANPYYAPKYSWTKPYRIEGSYYQFQNISRAQLNGIEMKSQINGKALGLSENWYANLNASYYRGRKSDGSSLLALQPFSAVLGIGYIAPSQNWNLLFTGRYSKGKKASEALQYNPKRAGDRTFNADTGQVSKQLRPHRFLSSSYWVFDLSGQYKINDNFILSAGIFNLFNRKYSTWESLRQIKNNGAMGDVFDDGRGLNRYSAPGRNFAFSVEVRF